MVNEIIKKHAWLGSIMLGDPKENVSPRILNRVKQSLTEIMESVPNIYLKYSEQVRRLDDSFVEGTYNPHIIVQFVGQSSETIMKVLDKLDLETFSFYADGYLDGERTLYRLFTNNTDEITLLEGKLVPDFTDAVLIGKR